MKRPEKIEQELLELRKKKKAIGQLLAAEIIMLLLIIVVVFTADIETVYVLCGVVLIYNLFIVRPPIRKYKKELTAMELMYGAAGDIADCEYQEKDGLAKDSLEQDKLLPPGEWPDGAICRHSVKGRYINASIKMCECSFVVRYGSRRSEAVFLSGTYVQADMADQTGLSISCISRGIPHISESMPDLTQYGLQPVQPGGEKARNIFWAFSERAKLPEWLEKQLIKLSASGSKILMSLNGHRVSIFLVSRFYTAKHHLSYPLSQDSLSWNRLPEKQAIFDTLRIIQQNAVLEKRKEK